jgi:carbamoyltransferase
MKILALYPYIHLSSSALLINGEIVAASPEERFDRQKMSTAFPNKSAAWCLKSQGLKWEDLDMIVVPWNPMRNVNHASRRWVNEMNWRGQLLSHVPIQVMRAINGPFENEMEIKWGKTRIVYMNHHECHAANGFFLSPFEEADILTIDGHGEDETCFFGYGKGNTITQQSNVIYPHSVGLFYGTFTDYLGFTPDVDEWKVMALSSFAPDKNEFDEKIRCLIHLTENGFELDLTYFDYFCFDRRPHFYHQKLVDLIGVAPRMKNDPITSQHFAIAGAMQRVFVETVTHLLKVTSKKGSGSGNIVLSGGAAMNSVFNGILDKLDVYNNSSISSCPDDSGVAVGAALLAWHRYGNKPRKVREQTHNYWGPSYSDNEIRDTLKKFKIKYEEPKNISQEVAAELANGKLIGWFQGAMEFGHRALGNRSILADPRKESTKDVVNAAVKYRESFRPFAPAVVAEKAEEIFDLKPGRKVRFMERVVPILPEWKDKLGAVNHVDGTGRVQTVERELNPEFYNLINEFGKITGVPVLLNTSYNLNGEPIVMTPEHAIRTFFSCGLDILVLGPYVVRK